MSLGGKTAGLLGTGGRQQSRDGGQFLVHRGYWYAAGERSGGSLDEDVVEVSCGVQKQPEKSIPRLRYTFPVVGHSIVQATYTLLRV